VAINTVEARAPEQEKPVFYESINNLFQFNRVDMGGLLGKGRQELAQAIERLKPQLANSSQAKIEVIGYSDFIGKLEQKQKIALERAHTVRMFAIQLGIPAEKISSQGRADSEPVVGQCTNVLNVRNIQCNQANRRVVVQVVTQ
jgi:outer membrane protein OmpA-like peptidoglycan-associated protein